MNDSADPKQYNSNDILALPKNVGRSIVESCALISCPLLGTNKFIKFCKDRNLPIDRQRLFRLERLGLFGPLFRIRRSENSTDHFNIPVRNNQNWFDLGLAWDTTRLEQSYMVPQHNDRTQEGYYSIFQIDDLGIILSAMTFNVPMDSYIEPDGNKSPDTQKWMQHFLLTARSLRKYEFRRALSLLCQYISERYYPHTQTDMRVMNVGNNTYNDTWINVHNSKYDWYDFAKAWSPEQVESIFNLTPNKLRHAYQCLSTAAHSVDPLGEWYKLVQFISIDERKKLKKDALRAQTLYSGALMLRLLYRDLYNELLPPPDEVGVNVIEHLPELSVRKDVRRYLEYIVNLYHLNPQPKLALFLEGDSEVAAVEMIFDKYYSAHYGIYGIELVNLQGVGSATGSKKEDRFRAIFRLLDYLHHHQTLTFLILDNENHALKLKEAAKRIASTHTKERYATRPDYIKIWKNSFEFDNFSCSEIAAALNKVSNGHAKFLRREILDCKKDMQSGARLSKLYKEKTNYGLPKVELSRILVAQMFDGPFKRKIEERPIIKSIAKIANLAARNHLPIMDEIWLQNQKSNFFGFKKK